jgi:anti-anti-sigma regulatory factor
MLRLQTHDSADALLFRLEGRFTEMEAEHLRMLVTRCYAKTKMVIDLTDITFVDSVGEAVLSLFAQLGAEFVAGTAYALDVCERLRLPLVPVARS